MNMVFVRGFILTALGFLLKEIQVITGQCGGYVQMKYLAYGESGSIKSPNYPYKYGNNENCKWRIQAPSNQKVLVYFTFFNLESCCSCDYVQIYDGPGSYSNISKTACGSNLPTPIYSSGRSLYITFHSDSYVQKNGFVMHYKTLSKPSGCPLINSAASAGVIYSPNFPWNYSNFRRCTWNITTPSWLKITLTFTHFDLETGSSPYFCNNDYVEVKGYENYSRKYCGTQLPYTFITYKYLSVTFSSDSSVSRSGFMAFYQIDTIYLTTPRYPITRGPPTGYYPSVSHSHKRKIYVRSSGGSITIQSPTYNSHYYPTMSPWTQWEIDTAKGYYLQLTFNRMSISSCGSGRCSCGRIQVYEESDSAMSVRLLGTYCSGHYPSTVTAKGNKMSVLYYHYSRFDTFHATVTSHKEISVDAAAIAVPVAIAVVLFGIIFAVIKLVKRSAGPTEPSSTHEVQLQNFNDSNSAYPSQLPSQNTEAVSPSFQEANLMPLSVDISQGR